MVFCVDASFLNKVPRVCYTHQTYYKELMQVVYGGFRIIIAICIIVIIYGITLMTQV